MLDERIGIRKKYKKRATREDVLITATRECLRVIYKQLERDAQHAKGRAQTCQLKQLADRAYVIETAKRVLCDSLTRIRHSVADMSTEHGFTDDETHAELMYQYRVIWPQLSTTTTHELANAFPVCDNDDTNSD